MNLARKYVLNQPGFRRKWSTVRPVFKCTQNFLKGSGSGDHSEAVFLNLSNAFSRVPHAIPVAKPTRVGIVTICCYESTLTYPIEPSLFTWVVF